MSDMAVNIEQVREALEKAKERTKRINDLETRIINLQMEFEGHDENLHPILHDSINALCDVVGHILRKLETRSSWDVEMFSILSKARINERPVGDPDTADVAKDVPNAMGISDDQLQDITDMINGKEAQDEPNALGISDGELQDLADMINGTQEARDEPQDCAGEVDEASENYTVSEMRGVASGKNGSDSVDAQYSGAGAENTDEMLFDLVKARIPTGDKEAQDETASDNARVENNTVGNTLRSNDLVCDGDTFDAQLEALRKNITWSNTYKVSKEREGLGYEGQGFLSCSTVDSVLGLVRPHLEQWAQKVAEAEAKLMGIDLVVSGCVAPEIVDKRLDCAAYRNACELRKERDALKAEVEKLKRPCSCGGEGKLYGEDEDVWVYCGCRIGKDMHINNLQADLEKAWESEVDAEAEVARLREVIKTTSANMQRAFTNHTSTADMLFGEVDSALTAFREALESEGNDG